MAFDLFGVVKGFVADLHEDMDAIAIEGTVELIEDALLRDETLDAVVLVDVDGAVLCEGNGRHDGEYDEAKDALHDEWV